MKNIYPPVMQLAMEKLLRHYEAQLNGIESVLDVCPLCEAAQQLKPDWLSCDACSWVRETGKKCINSLPKGSHYTVSGFRNGASDIPKQTLTKWRKRRVKELKEWLGIKEKSK